MKLKNVPISGIVFSYFPSTYIYVTIVSSSWSVVVLYVIKPGFPLESVVTFLILCVIVSPKLSEFCDIYVIISPALSVEGSVSFTSIKSPALKSVLLMESVFTI